jgi:hypothetical protein
MTRHQTKKNQEREEAGQVNINEALDVNWTHARDVELNHHEHCPGDMLIIKKEEYRVVSSCHICGQRIDSTVYSLIVTRNDGSGDGN